MLTEQHSRSTRHADESVEENKVILVVNQAAGSAGSL